MNDDGAEIRGDITQPLLTIHNIYLDYVGIYWRILEGNWKSLSELFRIKKQIINNFLYFQDFV